MGLDMYLNGEKFFFQNEENKLTEDGYRLEKKVLELGYWRKHPDLHGFIVQNFANGVDDCRPVELGEDELKKIIAAAEANEFPETSGFFFGTSRPEYKPTTIKILQDALEWLAVKEDHVMRSIFYEASW